MQFFTPPPAPPRRPQTRKILASTLWLCLFFSQEALAQLPAGWSHGDIGSPAQPGAATLADGRWQITGGGTDLCGESQFHFAWRAFNGDGAIITRMRGAAGESFSEFGLVIRSDLSPGSPQISIAVRTNTSVWLRTRSSAGSACNSQAAPPRGDFVWLKLARAGNVFTAYYSTDRESWTQLGGALTLPIPSRAYAGLAVCAYAPSGSASAEFLHPELEAPPFAVWREGWTGLDPAAAGTLAALTNLTLNPGWPDRPDVALSTFLPAWDTEINSGLTNYGQRLRGLLVPPIDGDYRFGIASHQSSDLLLSADEEPARAVRIAWVTAATLPREWARETNQISAPLRLQAGKRYYLESRMQHSVGVDHLTVRWQLPNGLVQEPLPALNSGSPQLIPFTGDSSQRPGILVQPLHVTAPEGGTAKFWLLATNPAPVYYQWRLNGTHLPGAQDSILTLSNVTVNITTNDLFTCLLTNAAGSATSAPVALTVVPDLEPPVLLRVVFQGPTRLRLVFSEPLEPASATHAPNYSVSGNVQVQQAALLPDPTLVELTTSPLSDGLFYDLFVSGVRDRSFHRNPIAPDTRVTFFASTYTPAAIGAPTPPGAIAGMPGGGIDLTGGGTDIGATSDQCQFAYQILDGDFDLRVRVQSLSQTDAYAKAGLMAREDLNPNTRYAATLTTPTIAGAFFSARTFPNARANSQGTLPVHYPNMWLRLLRQGDVFTGFAGYDGHLWQQLGTVTLTLSNSLYVGVAVSSRNPAVSALAQFRDLSPAANAALGRWSLPFEPPGPSSRKTGLAITEIMYHPATRNDQRDLEFIEILNTQPFFEDLSGFRLSGDIEYVFPPGTILPSGAYAVVAAVPQDFQAVYNHPAVYGPYTNRLSNNAGLVRLSDRFGTVLLEVPYQTQAPWPVAADGTGHSLVLRRPSFGEQDPRAWGASDRKGGSPGQTDPATADPADGVIINEFLAHTDTPALDALELFNRNRAEIDLSGCYLSDNRSLNRFRLPPGTRIPARGFLVFDEVQLGFRLDAAGETIYLVNAANDRVLDTVRFSGQANGISSGRSPDGEGPIVELRSPTLGAKNAAVLTRDIVINEIMYNPISGENRDEYVELHNKGGQPVPVGGWRFTEGIDFTFPPGAVIPPGGYLVVAKDAAWLRANYPNLHAGNVVGDFGGALSGQGEQLTLAMPDFVLTTNTSGVVQTNTIFITADQVDYSTGGRWGQWSDGGGSSLELVHPEADNRLAPNWADSDESTKAAWTTVEHTGILDHGHSSYVADQLHVLLQGAGECLVDNVEVSIVGSTNRIRNGTFEGSAANWFFQGTHRLSGHRPSGGVTGGALHLRASARGDTGANRTRGLLTASIPAGQTATLRARVRWLKGNPEVLLRLRGNWLEAPKRLDIPRTLGTPGARNSRYQDQVGPAIVDVAHAPILPRLEDPITVTARVAHPDGVAQVDLVYRNDTQGTPSVTLPMTDDGTAPDALAGDGVYTALIPAQGAKAMFAFHIVARDLSSDPVVSRFPADAPSRECLVQTGEILPAASFGVYRLWVNRANVAHWAAREKNSNDPLDATFVYGNSRVIYNMRTLYSGSPFHTGSYNSPVGSACDYVLLFPDDDPLLGASDFVIATLGNLNNDSTAQREQAAFWMLREMGAPSLNRRFIFMFVNSLRRGTVMEDAQQPNRDVITQHFPDDNEGNLHKIEDWFEFDNAGSGFSQVDATLDDFVTGAGEKKMARYRWCWRPRAVRTSANDFTSLFQLVDALQLNQPEPYTSSVESIVDVDNWMRVFALQRIVGNWDSFSYNRGKNMYAYKPLNGRWTLFAWDIDFVLGLGDGPTSGLFGGQDRPTAMMKYHPPFARAYWRAFYEAANGPMLSTRIGPVVEAKYAALVANGVNVTAPSAITSYVSQRRNYLLNQLSSVNATFSANNPMQSGNLATLTGRAPVQIKTLLFNGIPYPVTWTSVTDWRATLPLQPGMNNFTLVGVDSFGNPVPGASRQISINHTLPASSPVGQVVVNEIMVHPAFPGAEFIEFYNRSTTSAFDLSDWRVNGLSYTFPPGTVLAPNSFLVLSPDRRQYGAAYGMDAPLFATYPGRLQPDGETLTLFSSGTNPTVVARVRYEGELPWPAIPGRSYQLRDPTKDPWRVGNWAAAEAPKPQWQYVSVTGTASSSALYIYLESAGNVFLDDLRLVAGSQPDVGPNHISNGGFDSTFPGPWAVAANHSGSHLTSKVKRSGEYALNLVASSGGSTQGSSLSQNLSPALTQGATYTLSFWYLPGDSKSTLTIRLSGSGIRTSVPITPVLGLDRPADPGAPNSAVTTLAPFPPLWINELQPQNLTGHTNRQGERLPWIEIFNPTPTAVSVQGLYLAPSYTNLTQWALPADGVIQPGEFKVIYADGQTNRGAGSEWYANFALTPQTGSLALSRLSNGDTQVLDYVNYRSVRPDRSFGSFPDAQAFERREFFHPTPAGTNDASLPPIQVWVNEWMADNTRTLADPADGDFEDWFELYNPGPDPADLGGYYLTDSLNNKTQFQVPNNGHYVIPAGGFLLVWADNETGQNSTDRTDLHTNFRLAREGESLGLFGPDGVAVDFISFGSQQTDRTEGRFPDGAPAIGFLPRPTPGVPNAGGNSPPELSPIPDLYVYVGQSLTLAVHAIDPDLPPQTLQFTLEPGASAHAAIHSATGLFSWSPAAAPGTHTVSVQVKDNGQPSLSATRSFRVIVSPPPAMQAALTAPNTARISLLTLPGQTYELLYTADLINGPWLPAAPAFAGTGGEVQLDVPWTAANNTFYRFLIRR